ncbi:hypothetical protein [Roseateles sp. P5_E7]
MLLAARIAALIARRPGTRPADISRISGVSTASVSDWIHGVTKSMKPEPARKLSAEFGCDQNWLMTGIGSPNWRDNPKQAAPAPRAEPVTVRQAVLVIRNALLSGDDTKNEKVGDALKRLALGPDSDRTFEQVVSQLSALK